MVSLESRFHGCLMGCGVGDALGQPFEGKFGIHIRDIIDITKYYQGIYTDDTQLTLAIAESLIRKERFDPEDLAMRFVEWLDEPPIGPGFTCLSVANKLSKGSSWKNSGISSGANGAVMRISPVGLFYRDNVTELIKVARESSKITHNHVGAYSSAIIVARAVAYLTNNEEIHVDDFINSLLDSIKDIKIEDFKEHILSLKDYLTENPFNALMKIGLLGVKPPFYDSRLEGMGIIHPYACATTLGALYSFLYHQDSYLKAVTLAVKGGGDTDTVGAICGAVAGTWNGIESIPQELIKNLRKNNKISVVATKLYLLYQKKKEKKEI